jgi:hypothetical protein
METYVRFYAYLKRSSLNIYRSQRNIGIKAVEREREGGHCKHSSQFIWIFLSSKYLNRSQPTRIGSHSFINLLFPGRKRKVSEREKKL